MPVRGEGEILRDLKEIQARIGDLIIELEGISNDSVGSEQSETDKRAPNKRSSSLKIGDRVIIGKPVKGQDTIGTVRSIGKYFVSVETIKGTVRRVPQNLKKVG